MSTVFRSSIKLLIGIALFVGLPLVGWGIKDLDGFFAHPVRFCYIILAVLLQLFIVIKIPDMECNRGKGMKIVARQRLAVLLMQLISLAIVIVAPYNDGREIGVLDKMELLRYIGLVLFAVGFIVMTWAETALGRQFSVQVTIQEDHKLITTGPYRYLRHPRYLGIIIFSIGISLIFRSWLALFLVAALTVMLLWRIHDEEALMRQEFGAEWEAYSQRSWHLIPFVY